MLRKAQALVLTSLLAASSLMAAPEIAKPAPDFTLTGHDGKSYKLSDYKGRYIVLEWWNKDCPYVRKHYDSGNMQALQKDLTAKNVAWFTVLSSAPKKQGHLAPTEISEVMAKEKASPLAVLIDEKGDVGRLYEAKTTPHMYIIDPQGQLVYKGAIDDKPTTDASDIKSSTNYVRQAFDASLAGKTIASSSTKPYGCSVKY